MIAKFILAYYGTQSHFIDPERMEDKYTTLMSPNNNKIALKGECCVCITSCTKVYAYYIYRCHSSINVLLVVVGLPLYASILEERLFKGRSIESCKTTIRNIQIKWLTPACSEHCVNISLVLLAYIHLSCIIIRLGCTHMTC